ncbi:hypothetical protein AB205_0180910, partial [Aquarana catesbeiana]
MYLSRKYSHLRSVKLCSSLLVKNLMTSDLVFQPVVPPWLNTSYLIIPDLSFMEARHSKSLPQGVAAMPREMAFPVPKGEKWHDFYDFIRFPSDGSKLPYDSIQKGQTVSAAPGAPPPRSPIREYPRTVTVSKPVQDRVSLIQQITTPRPLPRANPLCVDSIPERYLSVRGRNAKDQDSESTAAEEDDGGIHVYAHNGTNLSILRHNNDSEQMVVVWNTSQASRGGEVVVMAKAHTDVDIQTMKIAFFDDTSPIGIQRMTTLLSPGIAINSLSISSTYCATGSEDGYLRLWPLDFSGVFLEAEHEGPVSCVTISPEGLRVLSCTRSGELGVLDVPTRGYQTLMRSHTDSLLAFSTHPTNGQVATVSTDNTIRIWDMSSLQQLYDFTASEETPCTVTFHPIQQALACGFSTGVVRYFDVTTTSLQAEHKQHRSPITGLLFSPDGGLMYSACSLGSLAYYSIGHKEQHVLRVLVNQLRSVCYNFGYSSSTNHGSVLPITSLFPMSAFMLLCLLMCKFALLYIIFYLGNVVCKNSERGPQALCLSKDGRLLAFVGPTEYTVTIMDARSLDEVFIGHSEPVQQVDFSPDQQTVISAGDAIFIWDFEAAPDPDASDLCSAPCLPSLHQSGPASNLPRTLHSSSDLTEQRRDSTYISSGMPRDRAPRPCISSPPRLNISPVQRVETAGLLSESDDGDVELGKVLHEQSNVEEVEIQDPKESDGQSSLIIIESHPNRTKLARTAGSIAEDVRQKLPRPDTYSHFNPRYKTSSLAKGLSHPPAGQEMLALKAVIGYNGNGRGNIAWSPDTGFFAYTCGCIVVVEDLHSGSQRHWLGHPEEISTLALTHDALVLASSSGSGDGSSLCQIRIWNTQDGLCTKILQCHSTEVQSMNFSRDDRLLITVGDFRDGKLALWSTRTYELLASSQICQPVHAVFFNPAHANSFSCVGTGAVSFWRIEEQGMSTQMKVYRAPVPDEVGTAELTSMAYNLTSLLYTGCSTGQVCVWDAQSHRCFMTWEADQGEIGRGSASRCSPLTGRPRGADRWIVNWLCLPPSSATLIITAEQRAGGRIVLDRGQELPWRLVRNARIGPDRKWLIYYNILTVCAQSCLCLDWSPHSASGQRIAAGYSDGTIRIFSVSKTEMEMKIHPHPCAVTAIAFSLSGEVLLSGGKDGLMAISSTRTGMTVRVLSDHKGSPITTIQCSRRRVTIGIERFYEAADTQKPEELGLPGGEVWLAASQDRRVSIWASDWPKDKCELLDWMSFPAPDSEEDPDLPLPTLAAFCPWQSGTVVYTGFGLEKEVLFYTLAQKSVMYPGANGRFL